MCGIVGYLQDNSPPDLVREKLKRMTDQLVHRGPDDCGLMVHRGWGIGMRRLSIIDLPGGHQPIANEAGDIHVVCNGEIYNFRELRRDLESRGHQFRTSSDTEVIVHLYEEYGDNCFVHLRGMFGVAILDTRGAGRVLVARDRLGKKPLFYTQRAGGLAFGSEMKSLLAADGLLRKMNPAVLGQYFQFGYIRQPETIYADILRLPAAHYGVYEHGHFQHKAYWSIEFEPDDCQSEDQWREQLHGLLGECVRTRLVSDVPLGIFLSGGLDSSAVVAYAHAAGLKPLKTFTIGFDRKEWDESADALAIARHFGTEHYELRLTEALLRDTFESTLQKIVFHCDEPFGDASAIPAYHVSRLASEHVTVILSGDGGDELFAGYTAYLGALFAEKYRRRVPYFLGRHALPGAVQAAAALLRGDYRYRTQRIAKVLRDSALPLPDSYRDKVSIWQQDDLRQLLSPEALQAASYLGDQFLPEPLWGRLQSQGDLVARLTEIDLKSYLLDDILVKVDRMSMAHSLEVRSPFLDHHLVEFAARLPTRYKIRDGQGKYLLRQVLKYQMPPQALSKRKQGFNVPLRDWFRNSLHELVQDYLAPGGYLPPDIFSQAKVQQLLKQHKAGTVDHSARLWLLLSFAAWHRHAMH